MSSSGEIVPNRMEVVDFAVEHDPDWSVRCAHRLLAAGEVDNGEPTVPHDGAVAALLAVLVRASVADRGVHPVQQRLIRQSIPRLGISENETAHDIDLSDDGLSNASGRISMRFQVRIGYSIRLVCNRTASAQISGDHLARRPMSFLVPVSGPQYIHVQAEPPRCMKESVQKHFFSLRILRQWTRQAQNFNLSLNGKRMQSVICIKEVRHAVPCSRLSGMFRVGMNLNSTRECHQQEPRFALCR